MCSSDLKALLKKECYQSAVRVVDLVSDDSNLASLHDMSRDLAQAFEVVPENRTGDRKSVV